ncbi:MAG: hypothetical protein JST39_18075 [Bacteroidetes bacterium]|nr:hypothetical protein [Bacteroidota bacterium]
MKKIIPSIAMLLIAGFSHVQAASGGNESPSEKSSATATQHILSDRLPARLLSPVKKNFKSTWITDLSKTTVNGKVVYRITVEDADKKTTMSATAGSSWSVTNVENKEAL